MIGDNVIEFVFIFKRTETVDAKVKVLVFKCSEGNHRIEDE
jgi:hypothetical protein